VCYAIDPYFYNTSDNPAINKSEDVALGKIGDFPYPTNPMNDRAIGYLLKGKVKNAVTNYGAIIDWDNSPPGLWGDYAYLPAVSFLAGVPGQSYSYLYNWINELDVESGEVSIWCSTGAFNEWFDNGDASFVGVVFSVKDDRGEVGEKLNDLGSFNSESQWMIGDSEICISLPASDGYEVSPLNANVYGDPTNVRGVGLIYPWALRPAFSSRPDEQEFERYDYGEDANEWTDDDNYAYYGATVTESWFSGGWRSDWQAALKSRVNTHNTYVDAGGLFGDTPFTDPNDTYPVLAHSSLSSTWPIRYNEETAQDEPFWPGWWAVSSLYRIGQVLLKELCANTGYVSLGSVKGVSPNNPPASTYVLCVFTRDFKAACQSDLQPPENHDSVTVAP
jgi:hypothetical protein